MSVVLGASGNLPNLLSKYEDVFINNADEKLKTL